jgi:phosphoglycolate phosphatase-like HAD superfamily hydrolase
MLQQRQKVLAKAPSTHDPKWAVRNLKRTREQNMKPTIFSPSVDRRALLAIFAALAALAALFGNRVTASAQTQIAGPDSVLPSWKDGPAKQAIIDFVHATTDTGSPKFVPAEERIATFDQDGTLWVEHPIYSQLMYCLDRVPVLAAEKPELKHAEPFKTVLSGNREAIAKLTLPDLEKIIVATLAGMTTDEFNAEVKKWVGTAKDPRWKKLYTELVYQPMLEVMTYLRANGYRTFIVTGFGQDFVRVYSQQVYGIPPEQVIGSALAVKYAYAKDGKPILIKEPKLMLNDNDAGKPEGIHLEIGRRPNAAFGNSTGDRQMLEYTGAGDGARLMMLVLHDDAMREYAYGPAQGLPDTKVGTFTQPLYDEAKKNGWTVISVKNDWSRIFTFE